jgi:hypothetical protein
MINARSGSQDSAAVAEGAVAIAGIQRHPDRSREQHQEKPLVERIPLDDCTD